MDGSRARELGSTRSRRKGFPQLKRAGATYTLRRAALAAVALISLLAAIAATTAAIEGHADAGVQIDASGRISEVSRTGFAWRDGIRPGQLVLFSTRSDTDEGWRVITSGPTGPIESREGPVADAVRASLPFAAVGLVAGCLALVFLRINREWALPAGCLALVCAPIPLFLANHPFAGSVSVLAALVPAGWGIFRLRTAPIVVAAASAALAFLVVAWWVAFVQGEAADTLDQVRRVVALGGTGLLMADRAVQKRPLRPVRLVGLQAAWIAAAVAFIAVGLGLVYFAAFPAPIVAITIVLGLIIVPPLRTLVGRRLELALMADLREHVAADVAEEERGRLARELHDAPLQELSAVIRRLELIPGARAETRSLAAIADHLRSVAVDLRPPMLDDLGLGSSLDFLAEKLTSDQVTVVASLVDNTGLEPARRPPPSVEFALYRITREAVTNALSHADAKNISISGLISRSSIDLLVADDGVGVGADATRRASGRGRLGLASMRRRAQGIGAELTINGTNAGTRVAVAWRA